MIYTITLNPAVDRELTIPDFAFDTVLRATTWQVDYGGKGFNVSRMLQSLGADSVALGFAGGPSGDLLRQGLAELGIQTDFTPIAGVTRTNVSIVTEQHDRYLKVNEAGPEIAAAEVAQLTDQVRRLAQRGDWWVLAGSLPPGVPDTVYKTLIAYIQGAGAHAVLDTSGAALPAGCAAAPFLVKPNDVELHKMTGLPVRTPAEVAAAARGVLETGVGHVVVSLGKKGALLVTPAGAWTARSPAVAERNPIGAGDSMVGGLVWGLSQGLSLPEALRWGIACGAATASMPGTAVGDRDLVASLQAQVTLQPLH